MIKFFRKVRQRLLPENKYSKYLIYAIGEIILVMIGILLALQVNNWNQDRLSQMERKEMLSKIHIEFKANKESLMNYRVRAEKAIGSSIGLIDLIGASEGQLSNHNLDSLFYESFPSNELAFADNAVKYTLQNGLLNLFEDDALTEFLYQWSSLSEIRKTRVEKLNRWNNEHFLPFLLPYISFREMDNHANYRWAGKSKVKPNYFPLFQKVEFENLLDNSLWLRQQLIERLQETEMLIDNIINASKA